MRHFWTDATKHIREEIMAEEKKEKEVSVTMVPIEENGRYLLIVQGLPHERMEEVMDSLRRMVETKGSVAVLEFADDIQWSIIKADDLRAAIVETTEENSEDDWSNVVPTA